MPAKGLGDPFSGPTNSLRHRAQAATAQMQTGRALRKKHPADSKLATTGFDAHKQFPTKGSETTRAKIR
jgi:hypothetical protein